MTTKDENDLDAITLLTKREVAAAIGVSPETISDWCAAGRFPKGFTTTDNGPRRWTLANVRSWIEMRARSRTKRKRRGQLRRGKSIPRYRLKTLPRQ